MKENLNVKIEEMLERVIYKLSMPLIHAKVGTDNFPAGVDYGTGKLEVDIVKIWSELLSL